MRSQYILVATAVLDLLLLLLNGVVAVDTGSRIVLSQAVFGGTDLAGSMMLLGGLRISQRPADARHPFGRGKERFFWAFAASLVTFSLSGLAVTAVGVEQFLHPDRVVQLSDALLVVGATMAASLVGVALLLHELRATRQTIERFLESSHLGLKTIFYQDVVAAISSVFAFGSLLVIVRTGNRAFDGLATAGVGVILIATGLLLAAESRELLVGRGISAEEASRIIDHAQENAHVRGVRSLQSMLLGPEEFLVALRVNFEDGLTTDELERTIDRLGAELRKEFPEIRHVIIEPES
jgi:cation diffusion facilitator family transporter